MEQEKRLKNLYWRIHSGYSLTMNDLLFLAEFDPVCFIKTYSHVVLNEPVERIWDKPIEEIAMPFASSAELNQQNIDLLISQIKAGTITSDVMRAIGVPTVLSLIEEHEEVLNPQTRQYQYYNVLEPQQLLNAQV